MRDLPGAPLSLAAILGTGGFILGMGSIFGRRRIVIAGLAGLALWYTLVAISFSVPIFNWVFGNTPVKPPLYPPILYLHLTIVMGVHIGVQLRRTRR
jgi:hypothetical protein